MADPDNWIVRVGADWWATILGLAIAAAGAALGCRRLRYLDG